MKRILYYTNFAVLLGNGLALSLIGVLAVLEGKSRALAALGFGLYILCSAVQTIAYRFDERMRWWTRWFCYTFGVVYAAAAWSAFTVYTQWSETCQNALLEWNNATGPARELRWHEYVAVERLEMENMHLIVVAFLFLLFYPMAYQIVIRGDHLRRFSGHAPRT